MACNTLKPPNVTSEMPSSLFLRQTASTCGTKSRALPSNPKPKMTATISFIDEIFLETSRHCEPWPSPLPLRVFLPEHWFQETQVDARKRRRSHRSPC